MLICFKNSVFVPNGNFQGRTYWGGGWERGLGEGAGGIASNVPDIALHRRKWPETALLLTLGIVTAESGRLVGEAAGNKTETSQHFVIK